MSFQKSKPFLLNISFGILLSLSSTLYPQLSDYATLSTYQGAQGPWRYLEYLFIVKPQNELNNQNNHLFSVVGIGGAATLIYTYLATPSKKTDVQPSGLQNALMVASAFAVGKTVHGYFSCITKRTIRKKTLTNFLKKWDTHRSYVPTAVVPCFDELALAYQSQGETILTSELITEVFELIQHHIEHNFENRYKTAEKKNVDFVENFKNITETWKNLG